MFFILASPPELAPNAGSEMVFDQPTVLFHSVSIWISVSVHFVGFVTGGIGRDERKREGRAREDGPRARNRSSERIAIAFTRRTETRLSSALPNLYSACLALVEEQD